MSAFKLSSRYAKSLITLANEQNALDEVLADMKLLQGLFVSNREFVLMMRSPIIHSDKKENVIKEVFEGRIHDLTFRFLNILILKGREGYIPEIVTAYLRKHNEIRNISPVKLTTAFELSEEKKQMIRETVKKDTSVGSIELESKVDPKILGGFIIQYEDKLIDASVSNKLKTIRKSIEDSSYKVKF